MWRGGGGAPAVCPGSFAHPPAAGAGAPAPGGAVFLFSLLLEWGGGAMPVATGANRISSSTRSGCSSAKSIARPAPDELPTMTARCILGSSHQAFEIIDRREWTGRRVGPPVAAAIVTKHMEAGAESVPLCVPRAGVQQPVMKKDHSRARTTLLAVDPRALDYLLAT